MIQQKKERTEIEQIIHYRPTTAYAMAVIFFLLTIIFSLLYFSLGIFLAPVMLFCLWRCFCDYKKADSDGLHTRTSWGKKQFIPWKDISDCYIGKSDSSGVIVLADGRKENLGNWDVDFGLSLPKIRRRIGEKLGLQHPEDWEMEGIRPDENWKHVFSERASRTKIGVDNEGIAWETSSGSGTATWDQIIGMRLEKEREMVVSLAGVKETEFRFSLRDCKVQNDSNLELGTIIHLYAPALKDKKLQRGDEVLHATSPKSSYPISDVQIYSYDTKKNKVARFSGLSFIIGFMPLIVNFYKDKLYITILTLLFIFLIVKLNQYIWQKKAQVEVDDLGIALVGPRGVKWRLSWLSIVRYDIHSFVLRGTLTTHDGKKYTFPRSTADRDELDEEIKRLIVPASV
jgi:hypothetical protein